MGVDQSFRLIGEAGAELLAGEYFKRLGPSGFLRLDRAPAGWFGLPLKRSWGVVPPSTDPLGRRWEARRLIHLDQREEQN